MVKHDKTRDAVRRPLYPAELTFIVKFKRAGLQREEEFVGRVEHASSGRAKRFSGAVELLEFARECGGELSLLDYDQTDST